MSTVTITASDVTLAANFLEQFLTDQVPEGDFTQGTALRDLTVNALAAVVAVRVLPGMAGHVADVDVLGISSVGIEGDAEGLMEPLSEDGGLLRLTVGGDAAEYENFARLAFRNEDVAVGGGTHEARVVETCRILLDFEAFGSFRPCVCRFRNHAGAVVDRFLLVRRRQVADGQVPARTRGFVSSVSEGILPGKNLAGGLTAGL